MSILKPGERGENWWEVENIPLDSQLDDKIGPYPTKGKEENVEPRASKEVEKE